MGQHSLGAADETVVGHMSSSAPWTGEEQLDSLVSGTAGRDKKIRWQIATLLNQQMPHWKTVLLASQPMTRDQRKWVEAGPSDRRPNVLAARLEVRTPPCLESSFWLQSIKNPQAPNPYSSFSWDLYSPQLKYGSPPGEKSSFYVTYISFFPEACFCFQITDSAVAIGDWPFPS